MSITVDVQITIPLRLRKDFLVPTEDEEDVGELNLYKTVELPIAPFPGMHINFTDPEYQNTDGLNGDVNLVSVDLYERILSHMTTEVSICVDVERYVLRGVESILRLEKELNEAGWRTFPDCAHYEGKVVDIIRQHRAERKEDSHEN